MILLVFLYNLIHTLSKTSIHITKNWKIRSSIVRWHNFAYVPSAIVHCTNRGQREIISWDKIMRARPYKSRSLSAFQVCSTSSKPFVQVW